ncbi:MAG: sulfur carrier protein ThiS [Burkholderiaceae bacterium]|nr:sulfur carrier protein ThiS [Burkholderiaceae bacterium]MCD8538119.1 sulfur carrier protein ThiS [Burkholderiaceae bacterium]MCD8566275.1 sulfur carrier protein ThiS [Burkholderiaceae bacterium]
MNITLNGEPTTVSDSSTVIDLLCKLELTGKRVAVEVNGDIVPRSLHSTHQLSDGDQVEVVVAVGGG